YVAEEEGEVRGVIAFHSYGSHLKEIRSLAVRIDSKKKGIGRKLVEHIIAELLLQSPAAKIFTLTVIPGFFKKFSFDEVDMNTLPEKIWKDCVNCAKQNTCDETALVYSGRR
ncbi:MAG: GNAT family N-acetyltransferase, partial [Spirochaetota bacterium]